MNNSNLKNPNNKSKTIKIHGVTSIDDASDPLNLKVTQIDSYGNLNVINISSALSYCFDNITNIFYLLVSQNFDVINGTIPMKMVFFKGSSQGHPTTIPPPPPGVPSAVVIEDILYGSSKDFEKGFLLY